MRAKALSGLAVVILTCALWARLHGGTAPEQYKRIIALNPSIVEIVYELGAEDRLVGISSYSDYPPRAREEKPTIGGIVNIDVERIISLEPDLVLSNPSVMAREKLSALGVKIEFVPDKTLTDVMNSFIRIGRLAGKVEEGKALAGRLSQAVAAAKKRSRKRARVKALAVIGYEPLWVAGGVGFLNELIEAAGGENTAGSIKKAFYAIDFERVLAGGPRVVIDLTLERSRKVELREASLSFWGRFHGIPAVAEGRIEFIDSDLLTVPGPRLVKGLAALEGALRPRGDEGKGAGRASPAPTTLHPHPRGDEGAGETERSGEVQRE